jgi:phosphinothricin acetyltransferase
MQPDDWPRIRTIYQSGIETGNATFESRAPEFADWDKSHTRFGRLVATENDLVVGWAALTPVSNRCVYAGVEEVSVYIDPAFSGKGVGQQLLAALIEESEKNGTWTLQAGIFPENKASVHIHEKQGFRVVGYRERVGKQHGVWRDTLLLERRSNVVGAD